MHDIETPSPWMVRHAAYVKPRSELLDVACGRGGTRDFFAARNVMVTAVDRDASALQPLKTVQNVRTEQPRSGRTIPGLTPSIRSTWCWFATTSGALRPANCWRR